MANREQRGNREKRKPKAKKEKAATSQVSVFASIQGGKKTKARGGK